MRRKIAMLALSLMLLVSYVPIGYAQSSQNGSEDHWAGQQLNRWVAQGLMSGYPDGSLRPDREMTRAEFTSLMNAVFGFFAEEGTRFNDIDANMWYAKPIAIAQKAGYISGYPDGSFRPNEAITREQAAVIMHGLFHLPAGDEQVIAQYLDASSVSGYARQAISSLVAHGYLQGYPDQTLRPQRTVTRAEAVVLADRIAQYIVNKGDVYEDVHVDGNMLINTADVRIAGAAIGNNVFLTAGIGEGEVSLEEVSVDGTLYIQGGGSDSVYLRNSKLAKVIIQKREGPVRVVLTNGSSIAQMDVETEAILVIDEESSVDSLNIYESAEGTSLTVEGTIQALTNEADGVSLNDQNLEQGEDSISVQKGKIKREDSLPPVSIPGGISPRPAEEWTLVWADEFDGTGTNLNANGIDLDKWDFQNGTGAEYGLEGWGNMEQQYYTDDNARVEDGRLIIEAKNDGRGGMPYTSAKLVTLDRFAKKYGKFEARIKLPVGQGFWPAFWMMPHDDVYGGWAASGEIDIMEARGRIPTEIGGTIHYGGNWPNNKYNGKTYVFPEGESIADFHTYTLEWEPGEIRWYVDGQLYSTINHWDTTGHGQPAKYAYPAPFDQEFYMILNLAIGGTYDGHLVPDEDMFPATMEVDYVRVYELTGRPYREPVEPSFEQGELPDGAKPPIDGNYIYDTQYEQDFTIVTKDNEPLDEEYWNFVYIDTFGGTGSVSVDTIGDQRFAKADIANPGSQPHSIQLIQHLTLTQGRYYQVSFDAKASAARYMNVKLGGGADRGWAVYSNNETISLTDQLESYEFVFQMQADSDPLARLEFNMGTNAQSVWIGNVKVVETEAPDPYNEDLPKTPLVDGNHVYNGTFDLGRMDRLTYWNFEHSGAAAASASVDPQAREVKVSIQQGAAPEDIRLWQPGIQLLEPNDYELTFKAKAESSRSIQVAVRGAEGTLYLEPQTINLTSTMEQHTVNFTMNHLSDSMGQLEFWLGGHNADVVMDDVRLVRLTDHGLETLPLEEQFPLKNGDFSNGAEYWEEHVQGRHDGWGSSAEFEVNQGVMEIEIGDVGNHPWDIMLMQNNFPLKSNQTYVVSVRAKSSVDREVDIVVEDAAYQRYVDQRVSLTSDWQTFTYEYEPAADLTTSFKLLMGKVDSDHELGAHTVFVDQVRVEIADAREKAFLLRNGDFSEGMDHWIEHVQGRFENWDDETNITVVNGVAKAEITNLGYDTWNVMLIQESMPIAEGETYFVSFAARSTEARNILVVVENSSYERFLSEIVELDVETDTYQLEFEATGSDMVDLKIMMGKLDGAPEGTHEIFFDNIRFELKGAKEAAGEKYVTPIDIESP